MLWAGSIVGGSVPLPHKAWANRVLGKSSFRQNQARLENKQPWQLLRAHRLGHDSPSAVLSGPTQDKSSSTRGSNLELSLEKELTSKVWVLCGHKGCGFLRAWYLLKGQVGYPFGSRQVLEKGEAGLEALSWEARGFFSFDSSNKAASWVFYLTSHLGLLHSVRALFAVLSASLHLLSRSELYRYSPQPPRQLLSHLSPPPVSHILPLLPKAAAPCSSPVTRAKVNIFRFPVFPCLLSTNLQLTFPFCFPPTAIFCLNKG